MDSFLGSHLRDDRKQYSEDDDDNDDDDDEYNIREIEEALLQRIHYAEDYLGADPGNESDQSFPQNLSSIKIANLPDLRFEGFKNVKHSSVKHENKFPDKSLETFGDDTNYQETGKSTEKTKHRKFNPDAETNLTVSGIADDFESDSKYKNFKKKSIKVKLDSEIIITKESSEIRYKTATSSIKDRVKLENSEIVTTIDDKLYVDPTSTSELINQEEKSQNLNTGSSELLQPTKRKWRKSREDSPETEEAKPTASKKVKIKRTSVETDSRPHSRLLEDEELRVVVDFFKSSDDNLSETMAIESHSEDEAMDVHYSFIGKPRSNQSQSLFSDKQRTTRGRYYQEPEAWPRYKCYNCLAYGHMSKDCPKTRVHQKKVVTCVLCSTKGHSDRQCPDALCYICVMPGHQAKECPNKRLRFMNCCRCSMKGHTQQCCPDRWRQFHLTTEPGRIIQYESKNKNKQQLAVNGKVYCYNCSEQGHFGHECWGETMDSYAPLILPYVTRYDQTPRRFWNVQMDSVEPQDHATSNGVPESIAPSIVKIKTKKTKEKKKQKKQKKQTAAADAEVVKNSTFKKCQQKTTEVLEEAEINEKQVSTLTKKEIRKAKKKLLKQRQRKSLERGEILDDCEETGEYGSVLKKRVNKRRYVAEGEEYEPSTKKRKWPKQWRRERAQQREDRLEKPDPQPAFQQHVVFQPTVELFYPAFKNKETGFNPRQPNRQYEEPEGFPRDSYSGLENDGGMSKASLEIPGGKKKKKKRRKTNVGAGPEYTPQPQKQSKKMSKLMNKLKRKDKAILHCKQVQQSIIREQQCWKQEQPAASRHFMSDRGFRIQPQH